LKCDACGECESLCEYTAILGKKKVKMKVRKVDVENVEKMKKMELVTVLKNPGEILRINLLR
jgi:flavoprotein